MTSSNCIVFRCAWNLACELLKSLPLGLRDQETGENTAQHEERENLHDVVEPWGGSGTLGVWFGAPGSERTEHALSNDSTNFAGCSRDTVRGGPVTSGEAFAGNDKGGCIWSEVEEELSKNVEGQEATLAQLVVGESNDTEENGEDGESHKLDRFATDGVDGGHSNPIARNGPGADDDQVSDGSVVEDVVHGLATGVSDS